MVNFALSTALDTIRTNVNYKGPKPSVSSVRLKKKATTNHENANNKKSTWRKRIEEGNFSQDEINAIAERIVSLKKNDKTKKRSAKEVEDLANFNYEDLEALDISDSESPSDDE